MVKQTKDSLMTYLGVRCVSVRHVSMSVRDGSVSHVSVVYEGCDCI